MKKERDSRGAAAPNGQPRATGTSGALLSNARGARANGTANGVAISRPAAGQSKATSSRRGHSSGRRRPVSSGTTAVGEKDEEDDDDENEEEAPDDDVANLSSSGEGAEDADEDVEGSEDGDDDDDEDGDGDGDGDGDSGVEEADLADDDGESSDESEEFEDQGSDSDDEEEMERQQAEAEASEEEPEKGDEGGVEVDESVRRTWDLSTRAKEIEASRMRGDLAVSMAMHTDDLSSDDDEESRNTIGRVPLHWYDEYDHIGYDRSGTRVMKRADGTGSGVDAALAARDDPNYARTVYDAYNDREVVLTDRELEVVRRIQAGAFPHPEFEAYPDYVDYVTHEKEVMPLHSGYEPKRRFIPSKWEMMKVNKLVKGIREGRIQLKPKKKVESKTYEMWKEDDDIPEKHGGPMHIPAPKMPLPGHAESYRPPKEYLLTEEEEKQWKEMDPVDRPTSFIPKSFDSLRQVGAYAGFVKERFERCLDLYLCPRAFKRRLNIDPESLVPRLPRPNELKPFPNALCVEYIGHSAKVSCVTCSRDGQWLASGDDNGIVILWEVDTARAARKFDLSKYGSIGALEWNPNQDHHVLAVGAGKCVVIVATGTGDEDATALTEALLEASGSSEASGADEGGEDGGDGGDGGDGPEAEEGQESDDGEEEDDGAESGKKAPPVKWKGLPLKKRDAALQDAMDKKGAGPRVLLRCEREICCVTWHAKGDYLASVSRGQGRKAVMVHQVSKAATQCPFRRTKGEVQQVRFHGSKPFLFVATKQQVRVYHLIKQELVKRLVSGCKWISCMDVHPSGDHIVVGSYDRRVVWFDLDLASTPYKTLKYHTKALRGVQFHKNYPLMASASDDGTVHVFHATVYSDLLRNPLVVPLKILRGHEVTGGLGVMALAFHPRQPWIFTAGADGAVRLFQDI